MPHLTLFPSPHYPMATMMLLQTQSPAAVLSLLRTEYAAQLASCTVCAGPAALIVTPDPCYGGIPNAEAGWIGYYAVCCPSCKVHFPGNTSGTSLSNAEPTTLEQHRAALQNAVDSWQGVVA
ncbi:MAG: hypothetical protein ACRYG7_10305 [Janthinobacterium lividum]